MVNNEKKSNIKQIAILVFFIIGIILGAFVTNNYNENSINTNNSNNTITKSYTLDNIPEYTSDSYVVINNNIPDFTDEDFNNNSLKNYSKLDDLGRCGVAFVNLSKETMPSEDKKRKSLDSITPSGWKNASYEELDLKNLYNKCHLIAFSLAGNDNEENIITGTRYFNVSGMLPFELKTLNYLKKDDSRHVLYRVKPIFEENNKLASRSNN